MKETKASQPAAPNRPTRNRKLYSERLKKEKLPTQPITPVVKAASQFQLAHLAATVAKSGKSDISASELASKALEIWNASGRALLVERQADVLVRGLTLFSRQDWTTHANALIAMLNDHEGSVPGQNSPVERRNASARAQQQAGAAVNQIWNFGSHLDVLVELFPSKNETEG